MQPWECGETGRQTDRRTHALTETNWIYSLSHSTPCLKNVLALGCYYFYTHERISIFLGKNAAGKVGNQKTLYYAISNNMWFCITWQNGKHENCIFARCISVLPEFKQSLFDYRQHCAQRKPPVFSLLRGRFWGYSPRRGDTLHRWGRTLAWRKGPLLCAKFHPHRCNDKGVGP